MQQNNLSGEGVAKNAKDAIDRYLGNMSIRDLVEHLSENTLVEHVRSARTVAVLDQCETIQGRSVDHYILAAALPFALRDLGSHHLMSVGIASLIRRMYPGIDAQVMDDAAIVELARQILASQQMMEDGNRPQPPVQDVKEGKESGSISVGSELTDPQADTSALPGATQDATAPQPDPPADNRIV
jgi:hypothetical protein